MHFILFRNNFPSIKSVAWLIEMLFAALHLSDFSLNNIVIDSG